MIIKLVTPVIN